MSGEGSTSSAPSAADKAKEFDTAIDIAKALITLATAILTLTITFSKDLIASTSQRDKDVIAAAWCLFFISILGGVWLLYSANGSISDIAKGTDHRIYDGNTAIPMGIQQVSFVVGVILTAVFGILAI